MAKTDEQIRDNYRCFLDCEVQPLTRQQAELMIQLDLAELSVYGERLGSNNDEIVRKTQELHQTLAKESFLYAIIWKRLERVGVADKVSKPLGVFIMSLCEVPGDAVMWAYTLCLIFKERGSCKFKDFVEYFPHGVPTRDSMQAAWEAQKCQTLGLDHEFGNDNWIDRMVWPI